MEPKSINDIESILNTKCCSCVDNCTLSRVADTCNTVHNDINFIYNKE